MDFFTFCSCFSGVSFSSFYLFLLRKVIAEPNGYELALGVDLEKELGKKNRPL
jgi:hypothetical protein